MNEIGVVVRDLQEVYGALTPDIGLADIDGMAYAVERAIRFLQTRLAAEAQHRERAEALEVSLKATAKALASTTSRLVASEQRVRALVEGLVANSRMLSLMMPQVPMTVRRNMADEYHALVARTGALLLAAEGESGEVGK